MHKMKRILVVDDEHDTCLTLTNVLEDNRVVVDAFDDPRLALENFRKDLYDLLILDIKMEKMNGLELYKEIKKIDNKVKVCFLTAGQFNYGPFIDVLGNLKENQFIQKPIENEKLIKIINEITSSNYAADTNSGNHHNKNKSILVVDDELDIVSIIEQSLQGLGFRVSAFTDPVVALEYFYSNFKICCSMVISDIRMPGMSGYEFARKVKGIKPECKIILMSAFDINNVEFPKVLQGVNIDTFLQKPFSMRKLKDLIMEKYSN